nr:unnamed protein product [Digitaria exilis]CAB3483679.1 unnamed protein product [Digitaria exilis]
MQSFFVAKWSCRAYSGGRPSWAGGRTCMGVARTSMPAKAAQSSACVGQVGDELRPGSEAHRRRRALVQVSRPGMRVRTEEDKALLAQH